jgi:zinc D-Ala-D-Ala dipeptidase
MYVFLGLERLWIEYKYIILFMNKILLLIALLTISYSVTIAQDKCAEELQLEKDGLVNIQQIDASLLVELKYSTTDNFIGKDVYGCITHCYLQKAVAEKLKKANQLLQKKYPSLRLLVYDGARARTVQWKLWNALPQYTPQKRKDYVADPREGSIHNYGCAIDLTVAEKSGKVLDMGTKFDYFGELAYPRHEDRLLKAGKLTNEQVKNRQLLRSVMTQSGFTQNTSEWWHYDAMSRKQAKARYGIIE